MLQTEHNDIVIREADPRVTMMLSITMRPDPQLENSLDYSERGNQLVGIAKRQVGVTWTDFPQSRLLEPETSETEKTIRELQTQLEQARKAGSVVDLRCMDNAGEPVKRL